MFFLMNSILKTPIVRGCRLLRRAKIFALTAIVVTIFGSPLPTKAGESTKRAFDLAMAVLVSVLAMPFMLLAAAAIALEGGGPIFYQQERVGRNGRVFRVLKFRTSSLLLRTLFSV